MYGVLFNSLFLFARSGRPLIIGSNYCLSDREVGFENLSSHLLSRARYKICILFPRLFRHSPISRSQNSIDDASSLCVIVCHHLLNKLLSRVVVVVVKFSTESNARKRDKIVFNFFFRCIFICHLYRNY